MPPAGRHPSGRTPITVPRPGPRPVTTRRRPGVGSLWAITFVIVALLGLLLGRLGQLQLTDQAEFAQEVIADETRTVSVPAPRGEILASDGTVLVGNAPTVLVTVDPEVLLTSEDEGREMLADLAGALDLPAEQVWGATQVCGSAEAPPVPRCFSGSPYQPIPVAGVFNTVDAQAALAVVEEPERFPGVSVVTGTVRQHPDEGPSAVHLAGYLGSPTEEEIADAAAEGGVLDAGDALGRSGLEQQYDSWLRGEPARTTLTVDPRGVVTGSLDEESTIAVPGGDLVTHIDPEVQLAAERALAEAVETARADDLPADSAAAVVLDVETGGVIAAASLPTYDPAVWVGGIGEDDYAALTDPQTGVPMVDRSIAGTYPPASTFKVVSLPAAMRHGVNPDEEYTCPGSVTIGGQEFTNFESEEHGDIDLQRVLEVSCDTTFYTWAYEHWQNIGGLEQRSDTRDPYILMAQDFGLGVPTGIDLPGESAGLVPTREWKQAFWEQTREDTCALAEEGQPHIEDDDRREFLETLAEENCVDGWQYRPGDAVNFSIGQGDISATPLQMAVAYAAIANGGTRWEPQLADRVVDADGTVIHEVEPVEAGRIGLTDAELEVIRAGLDGVNTDGTGAEAFAGFDLDAYPVAGKTGSAESLGRVSTGWYASYAPAEDPQYAVVVVVEQGGLGGDIAAPAARQIWEVLAAQE